MQRFLLISSLLFISQIPLPAAETSSDDQAILDNAAKWLAIMDAGQYAQAYEAFPQRITSGGLEQNFVGFMRSRRLPLGNVLSRKVVKVSRQSKLRGAPDGDYSVIEYETSFEHKAGAVESLTLTRENGYWQVSGYHFH